MDRHRLEGQDPNRSLDVYPAHLSTRTHPSSQGVIWRLPTSKAAETELIDLVDFIGKLAVILDNVDVVGARQEAGKGRFLRIPEGRRNDACAWSGQHSSPLSYPRSHERGTAEAWRRRTILDQDIQTLLDKEVVVEHDETEGKREHIVAGPDFQELADSPLIDKLATRLCKEDRNPAGRRQLPASRMPHIQRSGGGAGSCLGMGMLTRPCNCSLSRELGVFSDIVRLGGFGRRYDEGAARGCS